MMGVALDRYLPGRNAMLVNEAYVVCKNNSHYKQFAVRETYVAIISDFAF